MAQNFKSEQVMLEGVRAQWIQLFTPNTRFGAEGKYGIGIILDADSAELLDDVVHVVAERSDVPALTFGPGDVAAINMKASGMDRNTKREWHDTPIVYLPDLTPATKDDIAQLAPNKSVFNIQVTVKPYSAPNGKGVSLKLAAVQIVAFDGGVPSATALGFKPVAQGDGESAY